jgi:hypothetical protein
LDKRVQSELLLIQADSSPVSSARAFYTFYVTLKKVWTSKGDVGGVGGHASGFSPAGKEESW